MSRPTARLRRTKLHVEKSRRLLKVVEAGSRPPVPRVVAGVHHPHQRHSTDATGPKPVLVDVRLGLLNKYPKRSPLAGCRAASRPLLGVDGEPVSSSGRVAVRIR